MHRLRNNSSLNVDNLTRFRTEVIGLYKQFEEDLMSVGRRFGFEINMWYSPSKIPQPNFKVGRIFVDMDKLYSNHDFKELINENYLFSTVNYVEKNEANDDSNPSGTVLESFPNVDLLKKKIAFRQQKSGVSEKALFDFKQNDSDMRVKRLKTGKRNGH